MVGEAEQSRYGAGEGAPQSDKRLEDEQQTSVGELHSAPCPALQGEGPCGLQLQGDIEGTRERTERLTRNDVLEWAAELFTPNASFSVFEQTRAYNCTNPPPQVNILIVCS